MTWQYGCHLLSIPLCSLSSTSQKNLCGTSTHPSKGWQNFSYSNSRELNNLHTQRYILHPTIIDIFVHVHTSPYALYNWCSVHGQTHFCYINTNWYHQLPMNIRYFLILFIYSSWFTKSPCHVVYLTHAPR